MHHDSDSHSETLCFKENFRGHLGGFQNHVQINQLHLSVDMASRGSGGFMSARVESGILTASHLLDEDLAVIMGKFSFFSPVSDNHRIMKYDLLLRGIKSTSIYFLQGEKHLAPRRAWPWRLLDIWPDTTTVSIRLWRLDSTNVSNHEYIAMGIVRISALSFIQQLVGIRVNASLPLATKFRVIAIFIKQFTVGLCVSYSR